MTYHEGLVCDTIRNQVLFFNRGTKLRLLDG